MSLFCTCSDGYRKSRFEIITSPESTLWISTDYDFIVIDKTIKDEYIDSYFNKVLLIKMKMLFFKDKHKPILY